MTTRILCLWIPNWPIQRLQAQQPGLRERPLVLFAEGPRKQRLVVTHDRRAAALGVRVGMPLAEARTLSSTVHGGPCFFPGDPAADHDALKRLAWSCDRFSPLIGLEPADAPESLLLDITGCGPLFAGEQVLANQLLQHMGQWGLQIRIAIADTIGAAWAVAHGGTRQRPIVIVPDGRQGDMLRALPVTALRLPPRTLERLHEFQLRRIGQLLGLDRDSLPSRFGNLLLQRLDQACGRRSESIVPERPPLPLEETWQSEAPLQSTAALERVTTRLLERLLSGLQQRGEGVRQLQLQLTTPSRQTRALSIECVRPTTETAHLLELLRLRWERESFPEGLDSIRLTIPQTGRLTMTAGTLWPVDDTSTDAPELLRLIERLSSRLGACHVLRPLLVPDAQPERSFTWQPAIATQHGERPYDNGGNGPLSQLTRPVWLLSTPVPIAVLSVGREGPPSWFRWQQEHHLTRHWGPERITTGWWRNDYVRRDYYHVETTQGRRFWIFRELQTGNWFLHAND